MFHLIPEPLLWCFCLFNLLSNSKEFWFDCSLLLVGKRGTSSNGGASRDTERDSEQISGDHGSTTTCGGGESRFLMPPLLRVDPASDVDDDLEAGDLEESLHLNASTQATSSSSRFIRNGSELRRSLRRINSMTKRKLSPSSMKSPKGESKRKHSHDGSIHSQTKMASKVEPDYNSCLT